MLYIPESGEHCGYSQYHYIQHGDNHDEGKPINLGQHFHKNHKKTIKRKKEKSMLSKV